MDIKGKTVLITGGAVRIGHGISLAFAEAGANIIIHCLNSEGKADELMKEMGPRGLKKIVCDLAMPSAASDIFNEAGHVDILVNNASTFKLVPLADETQGDFSRQMTVNFDAPLELMKEFKRRSKKGCIVNILDQRIVKTDFIGGSYSLSKKALKDATISAAAQWGPDIRINAIAPGPVFPPAGMENSTMEKTLKTLPLKRPVSIKDLTSACIFLAENESVTGQILFIDCGQHLI
ncbi:MAG: hypothetical protein A2020_10310 [Lentisphaerae bacterium GWF2_45_14]|nr:MAG: hypothetical protein A2020_10310 [Lentisphaerae bacterium GWF2_45_14]